MDACQGRGLVRDCCKAAWGRSCAAVSTAPLCCGRREIGPIATPDLLQWAPGLPKTRSGKIMRRILRKIAENDYGSLGDTSTLADPTVVNDLIENRMNRA
jgi:hypothetical protein